jgi:LysM repeat protein/uncharacterized protein YvpB
MAPSARPPASRISRPSEDTATRPKKPRGRRKLAGAALVAGSVLIVASVATSAATSFYSISYGETLNSIARDHGTDVATLVGLNDIDDPDVIIAGDQLKVPDGDLISYTVREGDALNTIAAEYGVTVEELVVINKLGDPDLIRPGEVLLLYVADGGTAPGADEAADDGSETEGVDETPEATETEEEAAEPTESEDAESTATDEDGDVESDDEGEATDETPTVSGQLHLVQNDETLADVAAQYGVTEAQLIAANALESNIISNGMILKIPTEASTAVELIGMPMGQEQWPLMSEIAAASLATAYWGAPVASEDILAALESSPNPHLGFRGDPHGMFGTTIDYGVYNEPLAEALASFGFTAEAFYADGDASALTARIDAGTPVIAWVTHNLKMQEPEVVEDELGRYTLVPEQHAVVVYGYNEEGVLVVDVGTGASATWAWEPFMASWSLFDGMGLAVDLQ